MSISSSHTGAAEDSKLAGALYFCPSYPFIVTRRCANKCGYCSYPLTQRSPLPPKRSIVKAIKQASSLGAVQFEIVSGEGLTHVKEIGHQLKYYGLESFADYLTWILDLLDNGIGHQMLPLLNVGVLAPSDLTRLRPKLRIVQVFVDSADEDLQRSIVHKQAPSKTMETRMMFMELCGRLELPVATGTMIGLGESDSSVVHLLDEIARLHRRHGHIQSFEIQSFWPQAGTPMANHPTPNDEDLRQNVIMAREILPSDVSVIVKAQEHPHRLGELIEAGVDDFGGLSMRLNDNGSFEPLNAIISQMDAVCRDKGLSLQPRLPLHPRYFLAADQQ